MRATPPFGLSRSWRTIICVSDTHELHRELDIPNADWLIHGGDFTFFSKRRSQIRDFNDWLGELPHPRKVVVLGNHEFAFEADPKMRDTITNATLLINQGVVIDGLRVWGSPVTPLYGGAFGMSSAADRKKHWARIPDGTDILVTHGPPYGILDVAPAPVCTRAVQNCSKPLSESAHGFMYSATFTEPTGSCGQGTRRL